jgi:hypothetical protein
MEKRPPRRARACGPDRTGRNDPCDVVFALYTTSERRFLDTDGRKLAKSPAMRAWLPQRIQGTSDRLHIDHGVHIITAQVFEHRDEPRGLAIGNQ